jgi:hypothetical protein
MVRNMLTATGMLFLVAVLSGATSYPTPSAVPVRWELNFTPGELRLFTDAATERNYWYFTYMVENRTGRDQTWAPRFHLMTDAGEIMASGDGVSMDITNAILDMLGNELLMNQFEVIGDLLQGREHAKEGLVVWPARHLNVTEISLFISGISGETARVIDPLTGEEHLLRKTLQRSYLVPGNPTARGSRPLEMTEQRWIFR